MQIMARLVGVQGDQEAFADLIADEGELWRSVGGISFFPIAAGFVLAMRPLPSGVRLLLPDHLAIETSLGNIFTFKLLNSASSDALAALAGTEVA